jgi:hypothetical protein
MSDFINFFNYCQQWIIFLIQIDLSLYCGLLVVPVFFLNGSDESDLISNEKDNPCIAYSAKKRQVIF